MPEDKDRKDREDISSLTTEHTKPITRKPRYLQTLLSVFVFPVLLLSRVILRSVQKKPFFISIGVVCVIGWAWSITLSASNWWSFPEQFLTGIRVLPHLPLEEFLFYPLGGILSIFFYTYALPRVPQRRTPAVYWAFLVAGTTSFGIISLLNCAEDPRYLYSQFIVFNAVCIFLAPITAGQISSPALIFPMLALGIVGYIWDYFAIKYSWWVFHAILNIRISILPIEEFNLFLFAPLAAVSIYVSICRLLGVTQIPEKTAANANHGGGVT